MGVLCLSLIWGIDSYKWFFLGNLGFYPADVCSSEEVLHSFLKQVSHSKFIDSTLFCVVKHGKLIDGAKVLINNGADVNAKDRYGQTPLFWARNVDIAKVLINNGADVNAKDRRGQTPLFWTRNVDIAKVLINNGADVNAKDRHGQTPLFFSDYQNVANLLIKNGADINIKDNSGNRPKDSRFHYSKISRGEGGHECEYSMRCRYYGKLW